MPEKQSVSAKAVPGEVVSMNLDESAVYFFVRSTLSEEDQMVQVSHAILEMALAYDPGFAKYRIIGLDGGQSEKSFNKLCHKLHTGTIPHVKYADPDHSELGVTAIATVPLTKEQALPLANYRLRRYSPPVDGAATVGSKPSGEPSRRSSEKEHSVFNGEVAGSIPADGSKIQP